MRSQSTIASARDRRGPLGWYGGKYYLARMITPWIPATGTYVEVFGGGAQVLFALPPSRHRLDVYNDRDEGLVHFFRVLRDPVQGEALRRRLMLTPYSRAEWQWARATWASCDDPVERAARWFTVARMGFSGTFGRAWAFCLQAGDHHSPQTVSRWLGVDERLAVAIQRLRWVQVECADWTAMLDRYDGPDTVFYCDPPYPADVRRPGSRRVYRHEFSLADHAALVHRLLALRGAAMVSGYDHPIYAALRQAGWQEIRCKLPTHAAGRTRATRRRGRGALRAEHDWRTEVLWVSPRLAHRAQQITLPIEDDGAKA